MQAVMLLLVLALTGACGGGDEGGGPKPEVTPTPEASPTPENSPSPSPTPARLRIPLTNSLAIGIGDFTAAQPLGLVGETNALAILSATNQVTKVELPAAVNPPANNTAVTYSVSRIYPLGDAGVIVYFGHHAYDTATDAYWLKTDGSFVPFMPEGFSTATPFFLFALKLDSSGRPWFIGSGASNTGGVDNPTSGTLYSFDATSEKFTAYTDDQVAVSDFAITSDDQIYLTGRVIASDAKFVRRLKSNSGFDQLHPFYSSLRVFGRFLSLDNRLYSVASDVVSSEAVSAFPWLSSNGADPVVIGGRWWATWKRGEQTSALVIDMRDRKIAENPLLAREKSFWAGRPLGKDGSAFDGVNVVSLSQTSGVIKASWLKTLSGSATPVLRPKAAFGDLQGFATDWAVLADIPGTTNVYYLTAAAATGVLQSDNKKLLDFAVLPTTESGLGCLNLLKTTGHTYLISRCGPVTDPISRLDVSGTTVTKQAVSSSLFATQVLSYLYLIGTANADALYLAHYTTIGKIPDSGSEETISPGAVAGETDTNCATRYVYGIGKDNATTKPLVLLRPCASTGNASATQIYVVRYSDWTFTTVDAELSLGTAPSYELQFYAVASDHWAVAGKEGDKYFVFQSTNAALNLLNANGVIKTIARDGVAVFGDGLRGGEFDLMLPWDGTSFVVSGLTADQQFKSYRVDAAAATEAVMADLNGVQLYSGFVTKDYVFAVSGLDVASNTQIVARFDPDGTLVGKTSTSGVKVSQLVALPSPKP